MTGAPRRARSALGCPRCGRRNGFQQGKQGKQGKQGQQVQQVQQGQQGQQEGRRAASQPSTASRPMRSCSMVSRDRTVTA